MGHCVLCKDVLSFVFQTFDFQVLCFGSCVLCPALLNGAMENKKGSDKNEGVSIFAFLFSSFSFSLSPLPYRFISLPFVKCILCFAFCKMHFVS